MPSINALADELPPGYTLEVGGEQEEQVKSFAEMAVVAVLLFLARLLVH